jgi:hypothetical protein
MYQMRISTNSHFSDAVAEKVGNPKKYENRKRAEKTECHEIEPNPSSDRAIHEGD